MNEENTVIVGIADFKIAKAPKVLKTNLGSCIAVCLYDPNRKVGGMLHFMLAKAAKGAEKIKRAKYADTGMEDLISVLKKEFGVSEKELVAKVFGGAKVIKKITKKIGEENLAAVRDILKKYGIKIIASRTGGEKGYRISFDLNTGKVRVQIFGEEEKEY